METKRERIVADDGRTRLDDARLWHTTRNVTLCHTHVPAFKRSARAARYSATALELELKPKATSPYVHRVSSTVFHRSLPCSQCLRHRHRPLHPRVPLQTPRQLLPPRLRSGTFVPPPLSSLAPSYQTTILNPPRPMSVHNRLCYLHGVMRCRMRH